MKPVLQSTTKIAGAARAANFSKSLLICGLDCLNICYPAIVKRSGPPATYRITKIENEESPWMFAPQSPSPRVNRYRLRPTPRSDRTSNEAELRHRRCLHRHAIRRQPAWRRPQCPRVVGRTDAGHRRRVQSRGNDLCAAAEGPRTYRRGENLYTSL